MRSTLKSRISLTAMALGIVFASAGRVDAQMISVYSDTWPGSEVNEDDSLTMYGYGDADSDGEEGRLSVSLVIYDPSWNVLATSGDTTRSGFVSAQTYTIIYPGSPEGYFRVDAGADWEWNHYDCSMQIVSVGRYRTHYYLQAIGNPYNTYLLESDSTTKHCAHWDALWSQTSLEGLTDEGFEFGPVCVGKCLRGKIPTVAGSAGTPTGSSVHCG